MTTKKAYTIVEYINNFKVSGKILKSEKTLRCRLQHGIRPLYVEVYNTARGFILVTDREPDIKPAYQRKEDCFGESYVVKINEKFIPENMIINEKDFDKSYISPNQAKAIEIYNSTVKTDNKIMDIMKD